MGLTFTFAKGFWSSKTTWTVILAVLGIVSQGFMGELSWKGVIGAVVVALMGLFHNDTVRKGQEKAAQDRSIMLGLAMQNARRPGAQDTTKDAIAAAVAATVGQLLGITPENPVRPGPSEEPAPKVYDLSARLVEPGSWNVRPTAHGEDQPEDDEGEDPVAFTGVDHRSQPWAGGGSGSV